MVNFRNLVNVTTRSDPGKISADRNEGQPVKQRRKVYLPKERNKNALLMEQLPAHVWVQGEDETILFSNRMATNEIVCHDMGMVCTKRLNCHTALCKKRTPCSCCRNARSAL